MEGTTIPEPDVCKTCKLDEIEKSRESEIMAAKCTPDTSSKSTPQRKRTFSNSDHSSDTDSPEHEEMKCKRVHYNCGSGSSTESSLCRTDSESPVFLKNIPKYTSKWTEEVLPCLRVKVEQDLPDMYDVFLQGCLHFISDQQKCAEVMRMLGAGRPRDENYKILIDCYQHVFQHVFTLNYDNISRIDMNDLQELVKDLERLHWIEVFIEQYSKNCHTRETCKRILLDIAKKLQEFVWQLIYIIRKLNLKKEISEGMYQELFILFAKTFNLHIVAGSNVEKYSLDIGEESKFIAIPDALICHPTTVEDQICAVVEVKKYNMTESKAQETFRSLRSSERRLSITHQIGSDLKGQHVGQTLCVLSSSLFGDKGVFGILVQGTKVTLSSFKAEKSYYENLCSGFLMKKEAKITFSQEYNILRKDGRFECIQSFLDLKKLMECMSDRKFS